MRIQDLVGLLLTSGECGFHPVRLFDLVVLRITGYIPNRPHLGTYSELLVFSNHSLGLSYVSLVYLFELVFRT